VLEGNLPITEEQERGLGLEAISEGWRLACLCRALGPLTLELAQWEAPVLADHTPFAFTPRDGFGVAVDLGTTTIAAQLLDLRRGQVLAVETALNTQARHGADVMTRVEFAGREGPGGVLTRMVRTQVADMIRKLIDAVPPSGTHLHQVVLVGNTVMHHLFCGIEVKPLSHDPFEPVKAGLQVFTAAELGWMLPSHPQVSFLPCLGGFVGSDILAGIAATRLHEQPELTALIDLGTNGEIVIGNRDRLLCASTAAGPAFEGARITMGMRAATGAISEVTRTDHGLHCRVIGQTTPRGICGSGLVDAVATCLDLGWIQSNGRLSGERQAVCLCEPVQLTQSDIRELQLAKGAIAAGIRLLLARLDATAGDLQRVYLAGAFGNYINRLSARRIGLLEFPPDRVEPAGNTALLGAKLALFEGDREASSFIRIHQLVQHVRLGSDPRFEEIYLASLGFPGPV
jgi:uncharacterized 2Fe-2S/4Fe-4S cluster protein (DUF4445 family)